jgi:hypothetical protein
LFWLLLRYEWKTVFKYFLFLVLFGLFFDYLVLQRINDTTLSYSLIRRGVPAIVQHSQYVAVSDVLRGVGPQPSALTVILKKTATNLFNFYRLLPQIMSPYLFALFALGLFIKVKSEDVKYFKIVTVFTGVMIFLLAALTIPFFRYIHPVVPLIYIIAVGSLVNILSGLKTISIPGLEDKKTGKLIAFLIIVIFTVGINLGTLIHDYKYYEARNNFDKPPVYVLLSEKLKENTDSENFVITNLDTWGSWYGERKTMWFPLKPNQLIPPEGEQIPFDAIYLTSYLMDDENYYMGEEWRQIFYNPENPENEFIADNFEFKGAYQVSAEETYEKQDARAVLLVRKRN